LKSFVDFSIPYYETGAGYLAHIPRELSKWAALLRPYKVNVWTPLILTMIFLTILPLTMIPLTMIPFTMIPLTMIPLTII
jgi:hypothetical protein